MAAQHRNRHAVQIAGGREAIGVEVGVRIKPHHAQLFTSLAAMARHRADRADAQAVIAPQKNGQVAGAQALVHGLMHRAIPGGDFCQVPVAIDGWQPGVGRAGQIAQIRHRQPMALQRFLQACNAHRFRPHRCTPAASTHVGGCAYQVNRKIRLVFHHCAISARVGVAAFCGIFGAGLL